MSSSLENFPRGGKRIASQENVKRKVDDNLFKTAIEPRTKKPRKEKKLSKNEGLSQEESWQSALKLHGTLSYNKIQDGLIVLACIRHISNLAIQLEFPGLTFAQATINCISDAFTELITNNLQSSESQTPETLVKSLFDVGQLVPVKVLSVEATDNGHKIYTSLNPKDINADKAHNSFLKGSTIWANITSVLDHGYELSVGVKNCRVFLPFKNTDTDKTYTIGQPLFCVVHKCDESNVATTLTVSAKNEHLEKVQVNADCPLQNIIPGTKVEFCVEEVLPHGIKGKFLNNYFGYIDESQIFSKVNLNKVKEVSLLPAYVLYIEPITNVAYLTLRGLDTLLPPSLKVGQIVSAEVVSSFAKGLSLKLGKNVKGFVANKRLLNTLPKHAELDIVEAVKKKYPNGSKHSCRILDYNRMEELYICTFEQSLIKEKVFAVNDLKIGQRVNVTVDKVEPSGLIVSAGHVQGFVSNLHISNVAFTENVKAKYEAGKAFDARVLNITDEGNVLFTLKQGLVQNNNCLFDIDDVSPNTQYTGYVVKTNISGALVAFYGNAKGWISNKDLNTGNIGKYTDPRDYFFRGQVVNVWVLGKKEDKLKVSLKPPDVKKMANLKLGQRVSGVVSAVNNDSLDIELGKRKMAAVLPFPHLCNNIHLSRALLKTYKVGDQITNLVCIQNKQIPIVSRREFDSFRKQQFRALRFSDLKKGMILRCSFEKDCNEGIYVSVPIFDFDDLILIDNKNLFGDGEVCPSFEKYECILATILSVQSKEKSIVLSRKSKDLNKRDLNVLVEQLAQYLEDMVSVIQCGRNDNRNLTEYALGQKIECKIKAKNDDGSLLLSLPNGVFGSVAPGLYPPKVELGATLEGVVLDHNFAENRIEVCLKNDIKQQINKKQDGITKKPLESSCMAQKLLITKFYVLVLLKGADFNKQLAYLPLIYSDSNQQKIHPALQETKFKVVIHRRVGNKIIGVPKKLVNLLKKVESDKKRLTQKIKKKREKSVKYDKVESDEGCSMDVDEEHSEDNDEDEVVTEDDTNVEIRSSEDDNEEDADTEIEPNDDKDIRKDTEIKDQYDEKTSITPLLPGVKSFYATDDFEQVRKEESSSDEEEGSENIRTKKKKLTPAERAELLKKEEERIAKIEKELADSSLTPQSAEQFDRLLLANPNSSELWLKYIAMHVAATELEKARTVANRALETINMALIKEKFNIWIALLNLENMYGTKESFDKVFEEAVKYNEPLDVYLNVIKLLADSGKLGEMEDKIKKIKSKEKQNTKMWLEISQVYYSLGKYKEARNMKEAALKSILDPKRQFDLIVKFGIMEFQSGELEHAIANFETILSTYPTKINIWIVYVDQLVKKRKIEEARNVLERAIRQKFPLKSMKSIFQKFISFEEQHGTQEKIEEVKNMAKEYVKNVGKK